MSSEFRKGDKVEMTEEGVRVLWKPGKVRTGVVVGDPRRPELVRVRKDGQKAASTYSARFWRNRESGGGSRG